MFDENSFYKTTDIDLSEIQEPLSIGNLPTFTPRIIELDSDMDEQEEIFINQKSDKESAKDSEKESGNSNTEGFSPFPSIPTSTPTPPLQSTPPPAENSQKEKAPKDISLDLDDSNIIPEGEKRIRKATRKQAYSASLNQAANGNIDAFHASFSCFTAARNYYPIKNAKSHRNNLPLEPLNYKEMLNHPHANGFLEAIKIEINALVGKKT